MGSGNEVDGDVGTLLLGLGDRLLAHASSLRGLANERGDEAFPEGRVQRAIAGDVEEIARRIDAVRVGLCGRCRMLDVVEGFRVGAPDDRRHRGRPKSRG